MKIKEVNRTIHPDSHKSENSYRLKIGKRNYYDRLIVNIFHEEKGFIDSYIFEGEDIASFESIHFKAEETNNAVNIYWVQNIKHTKQIINK